MRRKNILVLMCVCLAVYVSKGQPGGEIPVAPPHKRFEAGVNLYSLNCYPTASGSELRQHWRQHPVPGLYFRYGKKRVLLRSDLSYIHASYKKEEQTLNSFRRRKIHMNGFGVSAGCQWLLSDKAVQPYFSFDIGYMYAQETRELSFLGRVDYFVFTDPPPMIYQYTVAEHIINLDPAIGIRWKLKNGLVFSLESGFGCFAGKSDRVVYDGVPDIWELDFRFKPVQQLSVGFAF
ncbi:MAG: hypothetical protein K0S33_1991 [Bacteroidetes bacterium]|jgi:hypothetical protein|nr:hypothetical protein [Bacteroidota bacterium]